MPSTKKNAHLGLEVSIREPAAFHETSKSILPPGNPLRQFSPHLAALVGLNEAIIINQIHFWSKNGTRSHGGHFWVEKAYREWVEEFPFWSETTIKRTIANLEQPCTDGKCGVPRGPLLIAGQFNKWRSNRTKWYRIDYQEYNRLLTEHPPPRNIQQPGPIEEVNLTQLKDAHCSALDQAKLTSSCTKSTKRVLEKSTCEAAMTRSATPSSRLAGSGKQKSGRAYSSPKLRIEARYSPAKDLLGVWRPYYRVACRYAGQPFGPDADELFGAKETKWYSCFCELLDDGHSPEVIERALSRAFKVLDYPIHWPSAFRKMFTRLADPGSSMATWGRKDLLERVAIEQQRAEADEFSYMRRLGESNRGADEKRRAAGLPPEETLDEILWPSGDCKSVDVAGDPAL